MYHLGSILLGIGAWVYGILAITAKKTTRSQANTVFSFSFCALSLGLQFLELHRRVLLRDFAAIEDTTRALLLAAVGLIIVTIVLNFVAMLKHREGELL